MEAIVLAGGLGTRLRKLVADVPKPMAPVAGRPFLEIVLSELERSGFTRIVLSVGYRNEQIIKHFGERFRSLTLAYVVETAPLGTGGAVRLALNECRADHVFVFNGDTYLDLDAAAVNAMWLKRRNPIVVARAVDDTINYGRLMVEGDRIIGFTEKGVTGPGLINAGCYVFGRSDLDKFALYAPFSIEREYFQQAALTMDVGVFVSTGMFIDIGLPEDYLRANAIFAGHS